MDYPKPRYHETVGDYEARCLHHEGRTGAEVATWTDQDWTDFQLRVNPACGPRTDSAYTEDMRIRLQLLTGEAVRIY